MTVNSTTSELMQDNSSIEYVSPEKEGWKPDSGINSYRTRFYGLYQI